MLGKANFEYLYYKNLGLIDFYEMRFHKWT